MRTVLISLVVIAALAGPRLAWSQPRPSDSMPEDRVGPAFDLPTPGSTLARSPAAEVPAPPPLMAPPTGATPIPQAVGIPGETLAPGAMSPYDAPQNGAAPQFVAPQYEAGQPGDPLEIPPQISPNAEKWRYMYFGGHWWYLQPSNRWSYWSEGRWVEFSKSRYGGTTGVGPPPTLPRRRIIPALPMRTNFYVAPGGPGFYPYGGYPYGPYGYRPGYYGGGVGVGVGVY